MSGEKEGEKKGPPGRAKGNDGRDFRLRVRSKTHLRNDSSQTVAFAGVSAFHEVAPFFDLLSYKKCFSLHVSLVIFLKTKQKKIAIAIL